jgi:transcriptional regulator of acetoin/glycerol metabolism
MNNKAKKPPDPKTDAELFYGSRLLGMEYYEDKLRKTLKEWKRFVKGEKVVDDSVVPRDILDSWERCRQMGVDPFLAPSHQVLSGQALASRLDANQVFIETSRPFMNHLYRFLEGTGFLVGLFDRDGYILEIIGRHDAEYLIRKADVVVGALWDERGSGTNAIGMVMALKKPYQVFGCQHYNRHYHKETASSAPYSILMAHLSVVSRSPAAITEPIRTPWG